MIKESETLELKRSTSELREAIISMSSIINKHGKGEIYFGIKNDGEVIGQQVSNKTLRGISQTITDNIEPKIYPIVEHKEIEGKNCIHISFQGELAPYFAYGRAYLRVADEDRQMSAKELEGFILKKNKEILRWDNKICKNAHLSDISESKLKTFLEKAGLGSDSINNSLQKLMLAEDDRLSNASVLVFAEEPQKFFLNAKLRCAVFAGTGTINAIDMQEYQGDLFYLIEEAQKYILKNTHIGMRIEGLERIDVPEIDKAAVREAVINAFCHRDYYNPDAVHVAVFSDRVEVRSPGLLYGGLTIERIRQGKVSERRNELIADILHRVHYIERWGQGIPKMLAAVPTVKFEEVGRKFIVVFPRASQPGPESTRKVPEKVTVKVPEKVTVNQHKILSEMGKNPHITIAELSAIIRISERKIKENIAKLKKKNLLIRVGSDKGGHWEIVEKEG